MANPIEATVLRAHDSVVITAYWDSEPPTPDGEKWLNLKMFRSGESIGGLREKIIRLSPKEADKLSELIQTRGNNG